MTKALNRLRNLSRKQWFYIFAIAFVLWPLVTFALLMLVYRGRVAPSYTSPLVQQLPLLTLVGVQLVVQVGLFVTAALFALRATTRTKRIIMIVVSVIALVFASRTVYGLVSYIDLIT